MSIDIDPLAHLPLLRVPPEILDRITWHLATTELCSFRLTCKSAERAVHFRFTAEFFTRKQFMVSEFSLRALIDISKSRLAGYLRHVHISLDQLDSASSSRPVLSPEKRHMYQQRLTEQGTLWTLGLVPKYLSEAFSRLPNLETVALRDFNSTRRSRDGPHAHWRSYGAQTLAKETDVLPATTQVFNWGNPTVLDKASLLFKAITHGLAMANARPKGLEMIERNGNLLYDSSFHIHPDFEAALVPVLQRLRRLHLCIDVYWATTPHIAQPYYQQNLAKFLGHCEALEELRINGKRNDSSKANRLGLHLLLEWLAATESTPLTELQLPGDATTDDTLIPRPINLAHLANISLGMMTVTVNEVVHLITKFAGSLEYLELWRVQLLPDAGTDAQVGEKKIILFSQLLKRMLNIPNLNLRHIKLGNLQQVLDPTARNTTVQNIEFKNDATADEAKPNERCMEYTGSDWRHFVRHEMIPRLYIHYENNDDGEGDNDDDDDDDDDEDDEFI
ncbi:hypothetical protein ACHAQJ_009579 [Trichoderma viride]